MVEVPQALRGDSVVMAMWYCCLRPSLAVEVGIVSSVMCSLEQLLVQLIAVPLAALVSLVRGLPVQKHCCSYPARFG